MTPSSNLAFIVAAYSATWLVLLGYLVYVVRRARRARREFERHAPAASAGQEVAS